MNSPKKQSPRMRVYYVRHIHAPESHLFSVHARDLEHAKLKVEALRGLHAGEEIISAVDFRSENEAVFELMRFNREELKNEFPLWNSKP